MVKSFDVVINVAGALHGQNMHGVHVSGSDALYAAGRASDGSSIFLPSALTAIRQAFSRAPSGKAKRL